MFQYGYSSTTPATATSVQYVSTQDPTLPTRKVSIAPTHGVVYFQARTFRIWGAFLALLAASTLALGIADVVLTQQQYCNSPGNQCSSSTEPYIWVWVASGIWASVPIFLCGIIAMCIASNPYSWTRIFALLCMLSGIVFAPAMVVLSSVEVYRGSTAYYSFYSFNGGSLSPGMLQPSPNPYQAKFGIPVAIAVIGGVEFIMTFIVTLCLCCCMHCLGIYLPSEIEAIQGGSTVISESPVATTQTVNIQPPAPPSQVVIPSNYYRPRPQIPQINNTQYVFENANQPNDYGRSPFPTRWNNVPNPYGSGAMFGNFVNRGSSSFAQQFMQPNPAYFWQ